MICHFSIRREIPANVKNRDQTQTETAFVQFFRSLCAQFNLQHFERIDKSFDEAAFDKQLAPVAETDGDANRGRKQRFF
jgi:hypothetical protein